MSLDRVKERIRALLAVAADDAAADGEIENTIAAARNLMHAHNLEESDIPKEQQQTKTMGESVTAFYGKRTQAWEWQLMSFVMDFVGGVGGYRSRSPIRKTINGKVTFACSAVFYGEVEAAAMATELFSELHDTILAMAKLQFGVPTKGPARSYADGFVAGLREHLKKVDAIALASDSKALVVQSKQIMARHRQEAKLWLQKTKGMKLRNAKITSRRSLDVDAYGQGQQDGRNQSLNNERKRQLT